MLNLKSEANTTEEPKFYYFLKNLITPVNTTAQFKSCRTEAFCAIFCRRL